MLLLLFRKIMASGFAKHIGIDIAAVLLALLSFIAYKHFTHVPAIVTTQVTPTVTATTVDAPVLTEKSVDRIISDPKDKAAIAALLKENAKLKRDVTQLTQSVATVVSHGGTGTDASAGTLTVDAPVGAPQSPPVTHFKDFRLDFRSDGTTASYDLTQKFEIFTSTARAKDGGLASLVKLYEIGAKGELLPVPGVVTTGIFADQTSPHWFTHLNVQAGVVLAQDTGSRTTGGMVGLQWLKRGRTKAPEDLKWAALTPVISIGQNTGSNSNAEFGLLPLSLNLGSIPHQPFTNLWVSPYVGTKGLSISRLGLSISATF